MKRVLFVCLGNICRSPAAQGVFEALLLKQNLQSKIEVESAGTCTHHQGERADRRMRIAANRRGIELHSRARSVVADDFDRFDWIVAMDQSNKEQLQQYSGRANVCLFSDFLGESGPTDVPDPYYGGEKGFERVMDLLELGCPVLLQALEEKSISG